MNQRQTLQWGTVMAGLAVVTGAFGAHALKPMLTEATQATYEVAVRYQFYHAIALLATGMLMDGFLSKKLQYAAAFFLAGIILFSGSLYTLCFTGIRLLGVVTPIGGLFFLLGWILLFLVISKKDIK